MDDYSVANYLLSTDPHSYYRTPTRIVWGLPGSNWRVTATHEDLSAGHILDGDAGVGDGGARYINIDMPQIDSAGVLSVSVFAESTDMRVAVISHSTTDLSHACHVYQSGMEPSSATGSQWTAATTVSFHLTPGCNVATLVITNAYFHDPDTGLVSAHWAATLDQSGVDNNTHVESSREVGTIRTPLQSADGQTSIDQVAVDDQGNSYVYDRSVSDVYGDGSWACTSCGGWLRQFDIATDRTTKVEAWHVHLDLDHVAAMTMSDEDSVHHLASSLVVAGTDASGTPKVEAFELGDGSQRYSVEPWIGTGSDADVPTQALALSPGPDGGVYYEGQWSCTIDCDYNRAGYLEVIDSRGSSVSQNLGLGSEQPGLWSAPDRRSVYTIVSHTYRWYVGGGYGDYQDCEYDSFVEQFDNTGSQVLPYSGPSLSTPCDDPAVSTRGTRRRF